MRSWAQSRTCQRSIPPQFCVLLQAQYQLRTWACIAQNNVERRDSLHDVTVLVRHGCRTATCNPGVRGPQDSCGVGREPFLSLPLAPLFQDDIDLNPEVRILRVHRSDEVHEYTKANRATSYTSSKATATEHGHNPKSATATEHGHDHGCLRSVPLLLTTLRFFSGCSGGHEHCSTLGEAGQRG